MKKTLLTLAATVLAASVRSAPDLEAGFRNPPQSAKPHTWWHWMNGNVTREGLVADLDAMAELGLGGAQIFDAGCNIPAGPLEFGSAAWYDTLRFVAEEANRRGLELCLPNCSGWSSSGGPWNPPANNMKFTQVKERRVTGPARFAEKLPALDNPHGFAADIAVLAVRVPAAELKRLPPVRTSVRDFDAEIAADESVTVSGCSFDLKEASGWELTGDVTVEASDDGTTFRPVHAAKVPICCSGGCDRGIRFCAFEKPVTAKAFRLKLATNGNAAKLGRFALETKRRLANLAGEIFLTRLDVARETVAAAPDQVLKRDDVIDLTAKLAKDGTLAWDVPAGTWDILRVGFAANGRRNHPASDHGVGLEVDKLSKRAVDYHMDQYVAKLVKHLGPFAGDVEHGLNNILVDSYEVGSQNWTDGLEQEFARRNGYSMIPFLPVFTGRIVESVDVTERFLWDYRRTVADLFAENYSGALAAKCHALGLRLSLEPYGNAPADNLQYGAAVDIPMGEFWSHAQLGDDKLDIGNSRFPAYLAHVWGRRYAATESFTGGTWDGGKWLTTPFTIKQQGDRAFANGVNRIIFHRFVHQPWVGRNDRLPGMTMGPWGMHLDRTQTWWKYARGFFAYQARCQWMLQEGTFVADALLWCGEDAPNQGGNTDGAGASNDWMSVPLGYNFDVCATDALRKLRVVDGCVVAPGGVRYRVLVLRPSKTMTVETLAVIEKLAADGATVVCSACPVATPGLRGYPAGEKAFRARAAKLWRTSILRTSTAEALARLGVAPDVESAALDRSERSLSWIHRADAKADWYFLAKPGEKASVIEVSFRQAGRLPELWDAEKGTVAPAEAWSVADGRTKVQIPFERAGSVFVVFRRPTDETASRRAAPRAWTVERAHPVEGPWTLSFAPGWGAPGKIEIPSLKSWTDFAETDIRYFSGTATYVKTWRGERDPKAALGLDGSLDRRVILDLGDVKNFAEVTLNGKTYPALWRPPYRVDLTEQLAKGGNSFTLEIKVTNLWVNRLIGDDFKPEDCAWNGDAIRELPDWVKKGGKSPTGRYTFTTWKHWRKTDKPLPSGLLGPVTVTVEKGN